ncbi:cardiolipin synthase B [Mycetohabitans endofungorum]|uniref:phospholipase D-like domain-containing protein n=1 Tax=Mycetohabitans endofungorum TaxID=417203 RepID=UPI00324F7E1F
MVATIRRLVRLRQTMLDGHRKPRLRFTAGNNVRIFGSGTALFDALIERIDAAEHEVALETYIFRDDPCGARVSAALARAAARGVHVRVITDGIGTPRSELLRAWHDAGIVHRIYNPGVFSIRFGFSRTHRKLAAVDRRYGFCGGHNVIDDRLEAGQPLPFARWDYSAEVIGPAVVDLVEAFDLQWRRIYQARIPPPPAVPHERLAHGPGGAPATDAAAARCLTAAGRDPPGEATPRPARARRRALGALDTPADVPQVAFVARDNVNNRRAIERAYRLAIRQARDEILVANPYFVPGRRMRRELVRAARRGVRVSLVIGRNEFVALDYAVPFLYQSLLRVGIRIAEYDRTMLHGKVAVVDGVWGTIGSSNLDALSLVLNHEANLVLFRHPEVAGIRTAILEAVEQSRAIDPQRYASRPWLVRVANWIAYNGYWLAMKLLTIGSYD